jgi:hypothetical protein
MIAARMVRHAEVGGPDPGPAPTRLTPPDTDRVPNWVYMACLGAIGAVSRLPQLLSPNLLLDGDECVLGLMAKHLAQLKELPIFFYGQRYGFSSIEAAAGALSFSVFGASALALKVAMLALWMAGVLFLFLALSKMLGNRRSFWVTAVFLVTPAWAVWSMKARGGYITSFTATSALVWLLMEDRKRDTVARWFLAGVLTAIIYLAQPLWLPGVLPIVAVLLISRRRLSSAVDYVCGAAAPLVFVRLATAATRDIWFGPSLGNSDLLGSLPSVAQQIHRNLSGAYYLWWAVDPPGPVTKIVAAIWYALLGAVMLMQLYRLVSRRYYAASHVLFLSLCSTLMATWMLLGTRDGRYLLPLPALLVLLVGVEIVDLIDRRILSTRVASGFTAAMLLLGALSMQEFRQFTYLWSNASNSLSEAKRLRLVINYLKARGVSRVFSMNGLLDTQLIFYSDEEIVSRWAQAADRYPAYVRDVNRALANGEPVAVVGYTNDSGAPGCWDVPICTGGIERIVPNPEAIVVVDGKYFVYVGANRQLLNRLNFEFRD